MRLDEDRDEVDDARVRVVRELGFDFGADLGGLDQCPQPSFQRLHDELDASRPR